MRVPLHPNQPLLKMFLWSGAWSTSEKSLMQHTIFSKERECEYATRITRIIISRAARAVTAKLRTACFGLVVAAKMAYLTFKTPDGDYCNWSSRCLAYSDERSPYCKFFQEFLGHGEYPVKKCPQCKVLGKYGTKENE